MNTYTRYSGQHSGEMKSKNTSLVRWVCQWSLTANTSTGNGVKSLPQHQRWVGSQQQAHPASHQLHHRSIFTLSVTFHRKTPRIGFFQGHRAKQTHTAWPKLGVQTPHGLPWYGFGLCLCSLNAHNYFFASILHSHKWTTYSVWLDANVTLDSDIIGQY